MKRHAAAFALAFALSACTGPPWFMGNPLDGRPSIPGTRKNPSYKELRVAAATARIQGETVYELRALISLDDLNRLRPDEKERLETLLARRAAEFRALGRAIPESRDLDRLTRLSPTLGAGLVGEHALADRSAGDAWLGVGAVDEARAAYDRAVRLGAADMDFRIHALWGHPPAATTPLAELRAAIEALPLRAVPPFALAYVTRGGRDVPTLSRALAAARQEKLGGLAVRVEGALRADLAAGEAASVDAGVDASGDGGAQAPADGGAIPAGDARPPDVSPVPVDLPHWLLAGVTVSTRLLPLVRSHPEILDDVASAVHWVDLLLVEDETSPEILALAALVFGRAARFGGTERMLMELAYATADRADAFARGAAIWERLGRTRDACVLWIRAARWRDDAEDPTWRKAISCARRDPGCGDWRAIRSYALELAPPDRRAALAATFDVP